MQEDDSSSSKHFDVEDYASTNSNSLMSTSTDDSSNDSSYPNCYGKKARCKTDGNGHEQSNNSSSSFNNSFNINNNSYTNGEPSSGTVAELKITPGNSSLPTPSPSSSNSMKNGRQTDAMKKIELIKRNFHISDESD